MDMSKGFIEVLDIEDPEADKTLDVTDELFAGLFRLQQAYCVKHKCRKCNGIVYCSQYLNGRPKDWEI